MLIEWEREWWFEINVYPAYGYNYDRSSLSATNIHLQMIKSRQSSFIEYWEGLEYDYDESMNCRVQLSSSDSRHWPERISDQVIVQHHLLMITPVKHSVTQPDNRHVVIIAAVFPGSTSQLHSHWVIIRISMFLRSLTTRQQVTGLSQF